MCVRVCVFRLCTTILIVSSIAILSSYATCCQIFSHNYDVHVRSRLQSHSLVSQQDWNRLILSLWTSIRHKGLIFSREKREKYKRESHGLLAGRWSLECVCVYAVGFSAHLPELLWIGQGRNIITLKRRRGSLVISCSPCCYHFLWVWLTIRKCKTDYSITVWVISSRFSSFYGQLCESKQAIICQR